MFLASNFSRTRAISGLALGMMAGLVLAKYAVISVPVLLGLSTPIWLVGFKQKNLNLVLSTGVAAVGLLIGIWRGQAVLISYQQIINQYGQTIVVVGRVADDPIIDERFQTEFHLINLRVVGPHSLQNWPGRLRIRGFAPNKLNRADLVSATGKLRPALGNRQGQISFARIEIINRSNSLLEAWRKHFFAGVYTSLPEPEASLGLGFLVGLRTLLPDSLLNQLSSTGLTHIVAVSGYNLTIMVRFTRRLMARYSKYLATATSLGLVGIFLAVTGISPSIFRASLVALLAIGAWYYGRSVKPSVLILVPAAITSLLNPNYVWGDIGWYLSFLAFFGVLVIAPTVAAIFNTRQFSSWLQILVETLAAQVMAMPLIMYVFGEVSLVAPLANLIILPLIPLAMILTFIAGLAGSFWPQWAGWLAWPASGVLGYIVDIIRALSSWSFASTQANLGWAYLLLFYSVILILVGLARLKYRDRLDPAYSVIK